MLAGGSNLWMLALGATMVGLAMGAEADIVPYLVSRMFALHRFTEMYGYAFSVFAFGGALGPALMGVSFDRFGNYDTALIGMMICSALATAMVLLTRIPANTARAA